MAKIKQSDFNKVLDRYVQENHIIIDNMTNANHGEGLKMYSFVMKMFMHDGMSALEVKDTTIQMHKLFANYLNMKKGY